MPTPNSIKLEQVEDGITVVFNFDGDGSIGWTARFVQMPTLRGTDSPVSIVSSCVLQIDVTNVDTGDAWTDSGPMRIWPGSAGSPIAEALSYPSSDGVAQTFVGIRSDAAAVTVESSFDRFVTTIAAS
ncbi:hypothetical protein GCM10023094_34930 [Rhodococcus olei]|uniref:AMIN-like domain-containing protein n=1 Tax=Rhodococcus olei TaxID=2161675 RepID=A0ABP8P7T2_9NOCA